MSKEAIDTYHAALAFERLFNSIQTTVPYSRSWSKEVDGYLDSLIKSRPPLILPTGGVVKHKNKNDVWSILISTDEGSVVLFQRYTETTMDIAMNVYHTRERFKTIFEQCSTPIDAIAAAESLIIFDDKVINATKAVVKEYASYMKLVVKNNRS